MREREQIEWEDEKGGEIREETDRIVVKTGHLRMGMKERKGQTMKKGK